MSKGYIIGGGGSTKLYACIGVTYPSGSTCTCTNGTKTLKAKGTSGTAIFNVPSTGTWTVTATNGDKTASKSVSITAEGQTVAIGLNYALYDAGDENESLTGGWGLMARNTYVGSKGATALTTASTNSYLENLFFTKNTIDLSSYTKLCATVTVTNTSGTYPDEQFAAIGITSQTLTDGGLTGSNQLKYSALFNVAGARTTTVGTTTLSADISSISSGHVLLGFGWTIGSCSKIWLE